VHDLRSLIRRDDYDAGGWCVDSKKEYIEGLVRSSNAKFCVEIGVFKGSSLLCFAGALRKTKGKIVGIDPWALPYIRNELPDKKLEEYMYGELFVEQQTIDKIYQDLDAIIRENNLSDTVTLVRKPSADAFVDFDVNSIDILSIDGNHDEINVSRDILLYLPLVKKNGYVLMDDSSWDGVAKSIKRFLIPYADCVFDNGEYSCFIKR